MKLPLILFLTGCLLVTYNSKAQSLTWDLENVDTTVVAGSNVQIYAHLEKDDQIVYSCVARVENINLPANWNFTLCNPFVCLVQGNAETDFTHPDMVNYDFDNEGHGMEAIKVTIMTASGNIALTGEMDLTFENSTTGESFTRHIIVRTNGQSVSVEENSEAVKPIIYPVPVSEELQIVNCKEGTFYTILDASGREITKGITGGSIDCSQLKGGNYFLQIVQEGQTSNRMFRKL